MTEGFYTLGYMGYYAQSQSQCAAAALQLGLQNGSLETLTQGLLSRSAWIAVAFVYTAQTGLNYRRYKKGRISKKEFWRRVKLNSVTTVGSLAVGSGGAAAGFALGTVLFPGVGSVVGAVVGGIAGGFAGEKLSAKAYKSIEESIAQAKRRKQQREMEEVRAQPRCRVSEDRYEHALSLLGVVNERAVMNEIEEAYLRMLEVLTENKARPENSDEKTQSLYLRKYETLIEAFEDAKEFRRWHDCLESNN